MNDALTRFSEAGAHDDMGSATAPGNNYAPKRRPVSGMAPLLVLTNENTHKEVVMTLAANDGGNQMISTTAQVTIFSVNSATGVEARMFPQSRFWRHQSIAGVVEYPVAGIQHQRGFHTPEDPPSAVTQHRLHGH